MNVRELLDLLEQFDDSTEVYFEARGRAYDVCNVIYGKVRWSGSDSPYESVEDGDGGYDDIPDNVAIIV